MAKFKGREGSPVGSPNAGDREAVCIRWSRGRTTSPRRGDTAMHAPRAAPPWCSVANDERSIASTPPHRRRVSEWTPSSADLHQPVDGRRHRHCCGAIIDPANESMPQSANCHSSAAIPTSATQMLIARAAGWSACRCCPDEKLRDTACVFRRSERQEYVTTGLQSTALPARLGTDRTNATCRRRSAAQALPRNPVGRQHFIHLLAQRVGHVGRQQARQDEIALVFLEPYLGVGQLQAVHR